MGARSDAGLAGCDVYEPSEALRPFVRRFLHGYTKGERPHALAIPPSSGMFFSYVDGAPLHVHFSDRTFIGRPRLFIGGQLRRESPVLESLGGFGLIGTEFTPTGFHRLFHLDAERFTDDITDARDLWPAESAALEADLASSPHAPARVEILDRVLGERVSMAAEASAVDLAVDILYEHRGLLRVEALADACTLSVRQLHRQFLRIVGVGPKHFAKIVQMNVVVVALAEADPGKLNGFAVDCGYFDQSHFIRDFQRYVGTNPVAFLRDDEPYLRTYLGKQR